MGRTPRALPLAATLVVALCASIAGAASGPPPPSPLVYTYDVSWIDDARPRLQVVWSAIAPTKAAPEAPDAVVRVPAGRTGQLRLCLMMERTGRYLEAPWVGEESARRPMKVSADDPECFEADLPAGAPLTATYTLRLGAMADDLSDLDSATTVPGGFVFSDKAVLARPEPTADEGTVKIRLRLPPRLQVATPWTAQGPASDDKGQSVRHFAMDVDSLDAGSYVAVGQLRALPPIALRGGTVEPVLFDIKHTTSDEALTSWVRSASAMLADFHGGLPNRRMLVELVTLPDNRDGGVFGTVMRKGAVPSVVLLYGGESPAEAFEDDWMAPHEIFHVGNPTISGRFPWFIEGVTTYYQDVIRGRAKPARAVAMWADLVYEFAKYCDGNLPLGEESRRMRELHHWTRVYWGGACLAFQADVAIRKRTRGAKVKESLDTVMRALLAASHSAPVEEAEVIAALDRAAGRPLVRDRLRTKAKAPLADLYRQLGIEKHGDSVILHDDAPLADVRKAIF